MIIIESVPPAWDDRDHELGLREKFAQLVASKLSGVSEAIPESDDYDIADKIAQLINSERDSW